MCKFGSKTFNLHYFYCCFMLALLAGLQTALAITAIVCNCITPEMRGFLDFDHGDCLLGSEYPSPPLPVSSMWIAYKSVFTDFLG